MKTMAVFIYFIVLLCAFSYLGQEINNLLLGLCSDLDVIGLL